LLFIFAFSKPGFGANQSVSFRSGTNVEFSGPTFMRNGPNDNSGGVSLSLEYVKNVLESCKIEIIYLILIFVII
jgi:hypothetical protein